MIYCFFYRHLMRLAHRYNWHHARLSTLKAIRSFGVNGADSGPLSIGGMNAWINWLQGLRKERNGEHGQD